LLQSSDGANKYKRNLV